MATEVELIETPAAFAGLRSQWNDLARRSGVDHAFMRHEWFAAYLEQLPWSGDLRILTVRDGGRLVGAAPLCVQRSRRRGMPLKLLSFLKSGISPRCNVMVDPDADPGMVYEAFWRIPDWDLAELKGLEKDDPATERLLAYLRARGPVVVESGGSSPFQQMPATWEEFETSRTKGFRKRFRNSRNRSESAEKMEIVKIDTAAGFDAAFADMLAVSRNSWKAEGGTDLVTQAGMGEFFRALAHTTEAEQGWVVFLLRLDGKPAAFDFYLCHDGRWVGLRWEYDSSLAYYMPGVVVHVAAIQDLIASGGGNTTWPAPIPTSSRAWWTPCGSTWT